MPSLVEVQAQVVRLTLAQREGTEAPMLIPTEPSPQVVALCLPQHPALAPDLADHLPPPSGPEEVRLGHYQAAAHPAPGRLAHRLTCPPLGGPVRQPLDRTLTYHHRHHRPPAELHQAPRD